MWGRCAFYVSRNCVFTVVIADEAAEFYANEHDAEAALRCPLFSLIDQSSGLSQLKLMQRPGQEVPRQLLQVPQVYSLHALLVLPPSRCSTASVVLGLRCLAGSGLRGATGG